MLSKKELHFFNQAKKEADKSTFYRIRIGCVIVKGNKILARGCNVEKSHPKQKLLNEKCRKFTTKNNYMHAELNAVLHSSVYNLNGATCYLYREDGNGNICCCKPCPACEFVLRQVGITTVYYTDNCKFVKMELI